MDPLSITASIVTVLGVLSSTTKAVMQAWAASDDFQQLASELDRLNGVATDLAVLMQSPEIQNMASGVFHSLQPICKRLENAQKTFQDKLSKSHAFGKHTLQFQRMIWITRRREVQKLKTDVVDIRHQLETFIQLVTLSSMSALSKEFHVLASSSNCSASHYLPITPTLSITEKNAALSQNGTLSAESYASGEIDEETSQAEELDEFLDAASHFSESISDALWSCSYLSGLSDWKLEAFHRFFPEQYVIEHPKSDLCYVLFSKEVAFKAVDVRIDRYSLLFAVNSRHWKRVILNARIPPLLNLPQTPFVAVDETRHFLPGSIQTKLELLLRSQPLHNSINEVFIELFLDSFNDITFDHRKSQVVHRGRISLSMDTSQYIREIDDQNVPQYLESEVISLGRTGNIFLVLAESKVCIQRKLPFIFRRDLDKQHIENFVQDMRSLQLAQGCPGIAKFAGIVLDDDRAHLLAYLVEAPRQGSLDSLISRANSSGMPVSWDRREKWIQQFVRTTAEAHKRGFVIGIRPFFRHCWIDQNDDLAIHRCTSNGSWLQNQSGQMPPEMRPAKTIDKTSRRHEYKLNFETDIFQLGMNIWLLARNLAFQSQAVNRFHESLCQTRPRHRCKEEHGNPVQLPSSPGDGEIPEYIDRLVRLCRVKDPKQRPSASTLLALIPISRQDNVGEAIPTCQTHDINQTLRDERSHFTFVCCDGCGEDSTNITYHCSICDLGNFDLCPGCIERGETCLDKRHTLIRRILKDGTFVNNGEWSSSNSG